ncbi:hypothetical protein [Modestobacter sp. SYSU DS0657]
MHAAAQGPETTGRHRRIDAGTTLTETGRHRAVSAQPQAAPAVPRHRYAVPDLPPPPPLVTPRTPRYAATELPPPPPLQAGRSRAAGHGRPAAQRPAGQRRPKAAAKPRQRTASRLTQQVVACSALVVMALAPVLARSGTGLGLHDAVAAEVAAVPDRADATLAELERGNELSGSASGIGDAYSRPAAPETDATPVGATSDVPDETVTEMADAGTAADQAAVPAGTAVDPGTPAPAGTGQPAPSAPTSSTPKAPVVTPTPVPPTPNKPTTPRPSDPAPVVPSPVVTPPTEVPVLTDAPPVELADPTPVTPSPTPTQEPAQPTGSLLGGVVGAVGDLLGG